jgi:carbamoyl-phosphate synthase large subunit
VIERERPDALLPTLGGQTALNLAVELAEAGVLAEYDVEVLGADLEAIQTAEDRQRFKDAMTEIGLESPRSPTSTDERRGVRGRRGVRLPGGAAALVHPRGQGRRHRLRRRRAAR